MQFSSRLLLISSKHSIDQKDRGVFSILRRVSFLSQDTASPPHEDFSARTTPPMNSQEPEVTLTTLSCLLVQTCV